MPDLKAAKANMILDADDVEHSWEGPLPDGFDDAEQRWEKSFNQGHGIERENGPQNRGGLQQDCFCQLTCQQSFLRKLERSAKVQFNWLTFCKELLYHTFFPFTLPLIALWEGGTNGIINRQFGRSYLGASQWLYSISFYLLNCLTLLYISPDIVIVDILWIMRNMAYAKNQSIFRVWVTTALIPAVVLATKYGFINKGEMQEMRERVLPLQAHMDRTLVLAWTNPIPLQVLKRELLLSAIRKDEIRCSAVLHLVPGASQTIVQDIMHQLSTKTATENNSQLVVRGSGWGSLVDKEFGFDQLFRPCEECIRQGCTKACFEDNWINICIAQVCSEPGVCVPKDDLITETDESTSSSSRSELGDKSNEKACPALDLPAVLVAAYIIQRSGDLLGKKNFLHQIFLSPRRIYWASSGIGCIHAIIPFAARAITGKPSTFGGHNWYHIVVSFSSLVISYSAMSASVMFMLAGTADFRRRYLIGRLLNTLLKDGWYGEDKMLHKGHRTLRLQKILQEKSVYHLGLAIDFSDPRSMVGWWAVRILVQDFGLVFHMRVKQYASYFATYCALLMAFLIVELFANGTRTAIYILAVVVYDLLVFICLLCLMVFPGGAANEMNHEHGATLVRKKMMICSQLYWSNLEPQDRVKQNLALQVLNTISSAIYWDNVTTQVTILGFTAGGELMAVLIGVGSAAVGIAAQQLTSRIH